MYALRLCTKIPSHVPDVVILWYHCRHTIWQYMLFVGIPSIRMSLPAVVLIGPSKYGTTLESKPYIYMYMYKCNYSYMYMLHVTMYMYIYAGTVPIG